MVQLDDEELLLRLNNFEDNFVERKTSGDSKDWLKTVVAFANSTQIGYPAVLYIGVKDNGSPEDKPVNLDSLQKSFSKEISQAYPTIYYVTKTLNVGGRQVLAVVVPGSPDRPHFAGQAYSREGSKTVVASKVQFEEMIASRNSKVYEILKWKAKDITIAKFDVGWPGQQFFSVVQREIATVADCNQFYVTLERPGGKKHCIPLGSTEVSYDAGAGRLELRTRLD